MGTPECVTFQCVTPTSPAPELPSTVGELRDQVIDVLALAGIADAEVDADLLLGHSEEFRRVWNDQEMGSGPTTPNGSSTPSSADWS